MEDRGAPEGASDPVRRVGLPALVLVVALALRVRGFTDWWLNPDEGIYYSILTRASWSGFWSELIANAHPPLYYLVLRVLGFLTWDFAWLRAFSVLCGLAAVAGAWAVGRELGGPGRSGRVAAFVAALLVALSPEEITMSQVMRPYMLQLALLTGALFFLLRYLRAESTRDLSGYTVLLVLALLTHYSSVLALGVFGLVVVYDGFQRTCSRSAWSKLARWHAAPIGVALAAIALHLRPLADTPMVDEALNGWLSPYMVDSLPGAWLGLVGYHGLLVGEGLAVSAALLLLLSIGLAVASGEPRPALLAGGAVLAAVVAAALGAYPLGATRHCVWLMAFTAPALAWLVGRIASMPPRRAVRWGGAAAALLVVGVPLRGLTERMPQPAAEHVLRREDLTRMVDLLDPEVEPPVVLMSSETFYLLLPFYAAERERGAFSPDGSVFAFPYGSRHVLVSWAWVSTLGPDVDAPGHLAGTLERASADFADLPLGDGAEGVLLFGAWHTPLMRDLAAVAGREPAVLGQRSVPGLVAYLLDLGALRRAF